MLLPIRTDVRFNRTPYANYAIIAVNVVVFLFSYWPDERAREILRPWAQRFVFTPAHPFMWQFITYAFLHSGLLHIFGNMFFLYIFGNNVNDKLGHFGYMCFYLAGAVFSAVGHTPLFLRSGCRFSGEISRRKCSLQVIPSGRSIHIHHLAAKK